MPVLSARGSELEGEFAWGVVRQLFERRLSDLDAHPRTGLLADAAALAAPALGLADGAGADGDASFATLHGLYWLTTNIARGGPLLMAVDDAHWADAPSLRFFAFLIARLEGMAIVVVMAARTQPASSPGTAELVARLGLDPLVRAVRPAPLSEQASGELVRAELGGDAAEGFCRACHEMTGGNPFLLRELVGALDDDGVLPTAAAARQVSRTTPEVVSRSVLLRLARLSPEALALARAEIGRASCRERV